MSASPARTIPADDPLAVDLVTAIRGGDVARLRRLLDDNPDLARVRIADPRCDDIRSLLHIATDWPGDYPNGPETVRTLIVSGADVNARFAGAHTETPLHWPASSDDVDALDALLDAGADIEADGAVIAGGTGRLRRPQRDRRRAQKRRPRTRQLAAQSRRPIGNGAGLRVLSRRPG
jgi:hypothetical protein